MRVHTRGNACTTGTCVSDACVHTPVSGCCNSNIECNDGKVCTVDICAIDHTCSNTPIAACCVTKADCDDGDVCIALGKDLAHAHDIVCRLHERGRDVIDIVFCREAHLTDHIVAVLRADGAQGESGLG